MKLSPKVPKLLRSAARILGTVVLVCGGAAVLLVGYALHQDRGYHENPEWKATMWVRTIRAAIQNWQATTHSVSCPTVDQLVAEKHLDSSSSTADLWGHPYELRCTEDEVYVSSLGPDGLRATADDIQVPKGTYGAQPTVPSSASVPSSP